MSTCVLAAAVAAEPVAGVELAGTVAPHASRLLVADRSTPPGFSGSVRFDVGVARPPRVAGGALRLVAEGAKPMLQTPETVAMQGLSMSGRYRTGEAVPFLPASRNLTIDFGYRQLSGDSRVRAGNFAESPPMVVVEPPMAGEPISDHHSSTGSLLSNAVQSKEIRIGAAWDFGRDERSGMVFGSGIALRLGQFDQDIRRRDFLAVPGLTAEDHGVVAEDRATIDLSISAAVPASRRKPGLFGEFGLRMQHSDAELRSRYRVSDTVGGGRAVDARASDSDASLGAFVGAGIDIPLGQQTGVSLGARYESGTNTATLATPESGADEAGKGSGVRFSDDTGWYEFSLGLIHKF